MPARRLYVHIGLQKTGTSYLQAQMLGNGAELAAQGLDLVPPTKREAFELMLMVRDRYHRGRDPDTVADALPRFAAQLDRAPGSRALLSQESLAGARPAQVKRFLAACSDREVHVVATVRDLARQVPSAWQQDLKAGRTTGYGRYLRRLQRMERKGSGSHPWVHLDPPAVLARWAGVLPEGRVHVVTVPPPGSSTTLLLERFCRVLEVDASRLEPEDTPKNTSLGRVPAEVLRRVNQELPDEVRRRQVYGDVGKRYLASQVLGALPPGVGGKIRVPAEHRAWCEEVSARQVSALEAAGYHVEGSLEDLRCPDQAFTDERDRPRERDVAAAAVAALAKVVELRAGGRGPESGAPASGRLGALAGRLRRRHGAS